MERMERMERRTSRTDIIGRQVGRYTVVSHLASGGMAELYVARQEAVGGFEKHLVLKLLQGRYAENPRVVRMFLDEARLAAKLNHPSIVHVYDVAEEDGIKFIAMEYIHGETLTDIVRRGVAVGNYLPIEHSVHIVSQTAAGLAYAHGRHDADGALLRIVHRDVSPSNILVSYEGQTKIVDFGIARIQDQIREESGMRPGKASYMSPEQVAGEGADYRSDIFSLGIILYEITLGQRLWRGPAEEVMRRIVEEKIAPPTTVRRDYPPALELIVMKALEKRPADRYQSAEDMRDDLEEFLDEAGFRTGVRRVALYLKELFAPEAAASDDGVALARQLGDDEGSAASPIIDDSEELNFDRRASFTMRVGAAPAASAPQPAPAAAPVPAPAAPPAGARSAPVFTAPAPAPSSDPVAIGPAAPGFKPATPPASSAQPPRPGSRGWLLFMILLLVGVGAMVFVALK
jgi:serine/threonine protein kinase